MSTTQAALPVLSYNIDSAHTSAHFKVRHMMISNVRGEFGKVTGTVRIDPNNPAASSVTAEIDVHSINTREPQRDAHLKSEDFLHAEKHPVIRFESTKVEETRSGAHKVTGNLTIRGVTRPVVLSVEGPTPAGKDPWGNVRVGAEATTKISRKDFGLTWNQVLETGGMLVGDEIDINIDVELIQA
ncbi:MAG TPA: YceI family protein [Bryobacteraceae bacterium]|nr:YceI family protein [Bryobacteraceae bacterium]